MKRKIMGVLGAVALACGMAACSSDADTVSHNLSKEADNFKVQRRIVFYNGITGEYILEVQGRCSIGNNDAAGKLSVTCKTGDDEYKKHYLGLSDNVTFFAEQLEGKGVSPYHYKVIFKPEQIVPDVALRTSKTSG